MITLYFTGVFLSFLCIWLLKNLRKNGYKPLLKVWHAILISIIGLVPIFNFIFAVFGLIMIGVSCLLEECKWKTIEKPGRLLTFLNKTIE